MPEPTIVAQSRELDALRQAEYEVGLGFAVPGLARHSEYGANEGISQIERFNALQRARDGSRIQAGHGNAATHDPRRESRPGCGRFFASGEHHATAGCPAFPFEQLRVHIARTTPFDWSPFLTPIIYLPILIAIGALATRLGSGSRPRKTGANSDAR